MQPKEYDFFISYKRGDSDMIAYQLAHILKSSGRNVWLDIDSIQNSESIRQGIDNGLCKAYCGIPILTHGYFKSDWTQSELDAMVDLENDGKLRIFPVRYSMSIQEIRDNSPIIASRKIFSIDDNLDKFESIVKECFQEIDKRSKTINLLSNREDDVMARSNADLEDIFAIGIDVGTAYIDSGIVRFPSDDSEPPQVHNGIDGIERMSWNGKDEAHLLVQKICDAIVNISLKCFVQPSKISYIGVGLPGQVNPTDKTLLNAPALKLVDLPIADMIYEQLTQSPSNKWSHINTSKIFIDNDVTCSAVAERVKGEGSGGRVTSFVCVAIGKGVGSGIVVDDKIYRGYNYNAGEVGHMVIDISDNARSCLCGSKGCFESYCSERGIIETSIRHIQEAKKSNPSSYLAQLPDDEDKLDPKVISAIISGTSPEIRMLREELAKHFAVGLSNIANIFNPKVIVITGGIGLGFFQHLAFLNDVQKLIKSYALDSNQVRIVQSKIRTEAQIIGAAMLGVKQL